MKTKSIARSACRTIIGILAVGALLGGCTSGGTGTTGAGFDEGPLVPFSTTITGKPGAMEPQSSDQAADSLAPSVEGHFGMTESDNTDQCTSTCTFKFEHQVSTNPTIWYTACSEGAGTACSIPGHKIEISDDPTYCVGKDNCLTAVITPSTSANSSCGVFLTGNKLSSKILTGGLDHIDFVEQSDFNCTTTAVGDFKQAGVRIAAVVGVDSTGAYTAPSAVNGTVTFEPSAGFTTDAALDAMYDEGYTWSTSGKQSAVYRVADKDNMSISAKIAFPFTLSGKVEGGEVVSTSEYGLLAGLQLCDEIDTGPAFCPSVATTLSPTFAKLGSSVTATPATKMSMATFTGGDRLASMKMKDTNTASLRTYSDQTASWSEVTGFKDVAVEEIDDVALDINENTLDWETQQTVTATVSVLTTDRATLNGTIRQSQDGFTWRDLATVDEAMRQATIVGDRGNVNGYAYVAYMTADDMAEVAYCNVDGCASTGLKAELARMGATTVTAISNIVYKDFNGYAAVAVAWKDANGVDHLSYMENSNGWVEAAARQDFAAKQMSLVATTSVVNDTVVSVTAIEYVAADNSVNMVRYDEGKQNWVAITGLRTYKAVDEESRMALAFNAFTSTAYTAVRDSSALKIVEVDMNAGTVREMGIVELNGYKTNYAAIAIPKFSSVDVVYENDSLGYAIAKESSTGGKIICDGRTCDTPKGGGQ
ncbi:MAG TPA: hypothetical protein VFX30_10130 [bacterium]|nr:hypothetical protein [bacterium]